jgi:tetratricopeptide (TPR) repeat protein
VLAHALDQLGRRDEAAAARAQMERLRSADANHVRAITLYNSGMESLQRGDVAKAREAFQNALSADPDFPEAHTNLGSVLLQSGEIDGAIRELRTALDLSPGDSSACHDLMLALQKKGNASSGEAGCGPTEAHPESQRSTHLR